MLLATDSKKGAIFEDKEDRRVSRERVIPKEHVISLDERILGKFGGYSDIRRRRRRFVLWAWLLGWRGRTAREQASASQ
jgi:hypothetical protein